MATKGKIILGVSLLALAVIVFGGLKFSNQSRTGKITAKEIRLARQTAKTNSDEKVNNAIDALQSSAISSSPIYRSVVDICYSEHKDMGWFVQSWYERCYLHYVSGFNTALSREEVVQQIANSPSYSKYFGGTTLYNDAYNPVGRNCTVFDSNGSPELVYVPANYQQGRRDYKCTIDLTRGLDTGALATTPSVKTYVTFDPNVVEKTKNQVWLIFDEYYFHHDIGCGVGLLCPQPRIKFVHPAI